MGEGDDGGTGAVEGERWVVSELAPTARSVAEVRRAARQALAAWAAQDAEWALSQLLSEVATNAVLHACTRFDVVLSRRDGHVRCEVSDASPLLPKLRRHSLEAATGRGLRLVEQLSTAWGVQPHPGGKTVWFEVPLDGGEEDEAPDLDLLLAALNVPEPRRAAPAGPQAATVDRDRDRGAA
jgi:anti-sigma regulatory factor (Ser/Thr protein kinase)